MMRIMRALSFLLLLAVPVLVSAQLSKPITRDEHIHDQRNKFLNREAHEDTQATPEIDEESLANTQCPIDLELRWQAEVSSSIYSTPVIADINMDGKQEIVVPSFVHYLEVLEGVDGERLPGWPVFHKSSAHTSPVMVDYNRDGIREIALADYNGEILFFHPTGHMMADKLVVPRLRVKKDWFVGLDPDHVDHRHPDIHAQLMEEETSRHAVFVREGNHSEPLLNLPQQHQDAHNVTDEDVRRQQGQQAQLQAHHEAYVAHIRANHNASALTEEQKKLWGDFLDLRRDLIPAAALERAKAAVWANETDSKEIEQVAQNLTVAPAATGGVDHHRDATHLTDEDLRRREAQLARLREREQNFVKYMRATAAASAEGQVAAPPAPEQQKLLEEFLELRRDLLPRDAVEKARAALGLPPSPPPPASPLAGGAPAGNATGGSGDGGLAAHTAFAGGEAGAASVPIPGGVAADEANDVQLQKKIMEDQWAAWHTEVLATGQTLDAEQQQRWDQFLVWQQQQRQLESESQHELEALLEQQAHPQDKPKPQQPDSAQLQQQQQQAAAGAAAGGVAAAAAGGAGGGSEGVAHQRRRLLQAHEESDKHEDEDHVELTAEAEGADDLDEDAILSMDVFKDEDENLDPGLPDEYQYDYDDYSAQAADAADELWENEDWAETAHETEKEFIGIDSHILCTPVVADIDRDGVEELIVAASYFFDREYYDDPKHAGELEEGVELGKYIAGAVVVFNLATLQVKWFQHLDLTSDATQFRAYIYSAPTVVDVDGDGRLEIVVGTSVGFIYILRFDGSTMDHWPVQMGELQGQVAAADINDDGHIEIVAVDTKGNVAAFNIEGKEIWERHTGSLIAQGATIGDVDGDGHTDVVVGTTSGHIHVFRGSDGADVGGFPFRTHGRTMAPILLVNLHRERATTGLHLAVTSFDGYLYVIDGQTACAEAVDVGETSYSMVLADNIDGGDDLDLIVSTMNGNVYCFQTPAPYHPLKAWQSQAQGRNVLSPRYGREGVYVLPASRQYVDVGSDFFVVQFEIVDARVPATKPGALASAPPVSLRGPYEVKVRPPADVESPR